MEKIQMKHTDPTKKTVAMELDKYETLKKSLTKALKTKKEMTFKEMLKSVTNDLNDQKISFQGSIQWHLAWVQMDMEAKNELSKDASISPQKFKLTKKATL